MFAVDCPRCETTVLLSPSRIRSIANTADGIDVHFRCWCGEPGTLRADRAAASAG